MTSVPPSLAPRMCMECSSIFPPDAGDETTGNTNDICENCSGPLQRITPEMAAEVGAPDIDINKLDPLAQQVRQNSLNRFGPA